MVKMPILVRQEKHLIPGVLLSISLFEVSPVNDTDDNN